MSPSEILADNASCNDIGPGRLQTGTGEVLDTAAVASEDMDRILDGYLAFARVVGGVAAAELYKRANPNSNLGPWWFEKHMHTSA